MTNESITAVTLEYLDGKIPYEEYRRRERAFATRQGAYKQRSCKPQTIRLRLPHGELITFVDRRSRNVGAKNGHSVANKNGNSAIAPNGTSSH